MSSARKRALALLSFLELQNIFQSGLWHGLSSEDAKQMVATAECPQVPS